jgi:hypothetical protein
MAVILGWFRTKRLQLGEWHYWRRRTKRASRA